MINQQNHRLQRFLTIQKFLDGNASTFSPFTRLANEITTYNSILNKIDNAAQRQVSNRKGIAKNKKKARQHMAQLIVHFAAKASVWATDTANQNLIFDFSIPLRTLLNGPASTALDHARNILTQLNQNIASLAPYNILPADLTSISNAITAFQKLIPQTATARATSKTATTSLPALFNKADSSLLIIRRLITAQYSASHPALVHDFNNCHRIGKLPVRHTGITAHITLASQNLEGAQLQITALNKISTSDINGITPLLRCRTGTYMVKISAPGCTTLTTKQKITRGHILHLKIELQKT